MEPLALAFLWLRALAGDAGAVHALEHPTAGARAEERPMISAPSAFVTYEPNPLAAREIAIAPDGAVTWFLPGCFDSVRRGRAVGAPGRLLVVWEPVAAGEPPRTETFFVVPWEPWRLLVRADRMESFVAAIAEHGHQPMRARWAAPWLTASMHARPLRGEPALPREWALRLSELRAAKASGG